MIAILKKSGWLVGGLIFFMPVLFMIYLTSQMAYSQVRGQFETYDRIPEITHLAELETLAPGTAVMLRGQISQATPPQPASPAGELVVYQERPVDGRETRYREEFPLIFSGFVIDLADGSLPIVPSTTEEGIIQHELHTVTAGDRRYTGFQRGDTVTVQGHWQPASGMLEEATGLTSASKAELMREWQQAFDYVSWARNGFGALTLLSLTLLIIEWRRSRRRQSAQEEEAWPTPETTTATT